MYYDAQEGDITAAESDLDSMSFARDGSSSLSFSSSTEREDQHDRQPSDTSDSHCSKRANAVSQLIGGKALRDGSGFSRSIEEPCVSTGDNVGSGRLEREDVGFIRALGFEYDEIARRVREGSI